MTNLKKLSCLWVLMLIAFLFPNQQVFGQSKADSAGNKSSVKPVKSVTSHSVTIDGKTIHYKAIAGILPIYNNRNKPIATIGYTAYIKKGVKDPAKRPIIFGWNGGPGASSTWVHMGILGPRRLKINDPHFVHKPYKLIDNKYSPLNVADVVTVDPVGTGFSRAAGDKKMSYFWQIDHDMQSISNFIVEFIKNIIAGNLRSIYLVKVTGLFGRRASPIFWREK